MDKERKGRTKIEGWTATGNPTRAARSSDRAEPGAMRPFQSALLAPSPSFSGVDDESMRSLTLIATTANATTSSEMHSSLKGAMVVMIILLLLLLLLIFLLACRPWRFLLSASSSSSVKVCLRLSFLCSSCPCGVRFRVFSGALVYSSPFSFVRLLIEWV